MKKIFSIRKIQFGLPLLGAMFLFTISNAQLVQKWQREVFSLGSRPLVKNAVLLTSDGNIVSAGTTKLMKFNPDGNQLWAADLPKAARPRSNGTAMATDQSGNIYLTIVGGADVNINFGDIDIFIAKYNAAGQQLWSKIYNSPEGGDDESVGIGIDQLGNVYITGNVYIDDNRQRIHTAKFNTDGILQWSVTYNDVSFSLARAIAVDFFTGDVYVAGKTFQGVDEDDPHFDDFTTIKYNTNGEQQWIALYNGNPPDFGVPNDEARAIALDADGNVLVTGFSNESFESNSAGTQDAFVFSTFKYDRITGHEIWHKKYGAGESEGGDTFNDIANAIAVDDDGNVIVTGTARLKTDGSTEWATIKYRKSDGKTVWDKRFNNKEFIPSDIFDDDQDAAFAVAVDAANNVYVTGYSTGERNRQRFFYCQIPGFKWN
jgi:hypothetical protein